MQVVWSRKVAAPPRGLVLARERGWLLVWDSDHVLHLFNRTGETQARFQAADAVVAACCADDGVGFAAVGAQGLVWMLAPDLSPRWERTLPQRGTAAALDPFGQFLAAADAGGGLVLYDRTGRERWRAANARPLHHLAFVPERPALIAAADFGLVVCYGIGGDLLWRDTPVAHTASLAVSGDGAVIALACFSDGLCCYSLDGPKRRRIEGPGPCRLAAASYDGDLFLTADLNQRLQLRDAQGNLRGEWLMDGAPTDLALAALGDLAYVAATDGRILMLRTS
ncbi:MAG TPA: PQQ-binding-like beta-propeller repeat protein [Gemmataceae bacterium]|nr:PQQ-binding-like beta-propeller repeat protein [Gemmataceae bacterium]